MGCCESKSAAATDRGQASGYGQVPSADAGRRGGNRHQDRGGGRATGGAPAPATAAERRAAAADAAAARATAAEPGLTREAKARMTERRIKDELLGKIDEQCRRLGVDRPLGLPMASVETLRKQLADMRGRRS